MAENQESIFGFEKSPRNCHSSMANKRKIEKKKVAKKKFFFNSDEKQKKKLLVMHFFKERKQADEFIYFKIYSQLCLTNQ